MEWWDIVSATVVEEFSDLADLAETTRLMLRLGLATLLGGALGYERASKGKAAGVRTHMLVALGSALFVLAPHMSGAGQEALSRVIQGIAAGVGFLGAGTIIKGNSVHQVHGLTTAAGIWLTAAIGIAVGMGREATAVLSTLLALVIFLLIPKVSSSDPDHEAGPPEPKP
jgi:putative Mg2+ transporter-C (MgtC) family protein